MCASWLLLLEQKGKLKKELSLAGRENSKKNTKILRQKNFKRILRKIFMEIALR
jgi:hypothetical protein